MLSENHWEDQSSARYNEFFVRGTKYYTRESLANEKLLHCHRQLLLCAKLLNSLPKGELFEVQLNTLRILRPRIIQRHFMRYWDQLGPAIREMFESTEEDFSRPIYALRANRQIGKTYGTAALIKSMILSVPLDDGRPFTVAIVAQKKALSGLIMQEVKDMLDASTYFKDHFKVLENNTLVLVIKNKNERNGGIRKVIVSAGRKVSIHHTPTTHKKRGQEQLSSHHLFNNKFQFAVGITMDASPIRHGMVPV